MEHSAQKGAVGRKIKGLRQRRGLTALALANAVGVTENAIRKIESGASAEPRFSTGMRIAQALEVEPRELLGTRSQRTRTGIDLVEVIRAIRSCKERLLQQNLRHVAVFGSVARGNVSDESDVDILIDPSPNRSLSLMNISAINIILESMLGRKVDVITRGTAENNQLHEVLEESIRVF